MKTKLVDMGSKWHSVVFQGCIGNCSDPTFHHFIEISDPTGGFRQDFHWGPMLSMFPPRRLTHGFVERHFPTNGGGFRYIHEQSIRNGMYMIPSIYNPGCSKTNIFII